MPTSTILIIASLCILIPAIRKANHLHQNESPHSGRSLLTAPTEKPIINTTMDLLCIDDLDIIFILDSSGSVYDSQYINWQYELDTVKTIINSSIPTTKSRVGLINFSGCGASFDVPQCKAQGRLKKEFGLNSYGYPYNDLQAVYDRISAMGPNDFNGGYTWTREALEIALTEFQHNSTMYREKVIILITDGEPFPPNADPPHEPCKASANFISQTLRDIRAEGIRLIAAGVDVSQSTIDDFFTCIVEKRDNFNYMAGFDALLTSFTGKIQFNLCPDTTTEEPTTSSPTTLEPTSSSPTTSEPTTAEPTTSMPTTSEPTTVEPTENPVTKAPTMVGDTRAPTMEPTTVSPTSMPTTGEPTTAAPTTASPTYSPTSEPSMEPTYGTTIYVSSSTEIVEETTEDIEAKQCPGLDLTITLFYFFQYDKVQKACDICLYEEGDGSTTSRRLASGRQQRTCKKIDDFIEGIIDNYAKCMLNVCDYECTIDKLQLNPKFIAEDDSCGCNIFECGPQAASANRYNRLLSILLAILFVAFMWM